MMFQNKKLTLRLLFFYLGSLSGETIGLILSDIEVMFAGVPGFVSPQSLSMYRLLFLSRENVFKCGFDGWYVVLLWFRVKICELLNLNL